MKPYLSVVIPAFNEEHRVINSLAAVDHYLAKQPYPSEIVVVIDGSTDRTLEVVREFAVGKEHIRWIARPQNRGKGYSVREGMLAAKGQIRLFTDADNSTDISHFDSMQPFFEQGFDVVFCSRNPKDAPGAHQVISQPKLKRFLGNVGNLFIQLVAVPGVWDTQCGFKAMTQDACDRIFSVARIDRWGFDVELLALAKRFRLKMGVVPAQWVNHADTNVSLLSYLEVLFETLKVRWNLATGIYDKHLTVKNIPVRPAGGIPVKQTVGNRQWRVDE